MKYGQTTSAGTAFQKLSWATPIVNNHAANHSIPIPGMDTEIERGRRSASVPHAGCGRASVSALMQFLAIPADSTSELLPWARRLSIAACRQSISLAPVSDAEQFPALVRSLDKEMAPSIEIYRDAMVVRSARSGAAASHRPPLGP